MAETALSKNNPYKRIPGTLLYTKPDEVKQQEKEEAQENWEMLKAAGKGFGSGTMDLANSMYGDDGQERFQWSWLFSNPAKFLGELGGNIGHWAVNTGHKGYGTEGQDQEIDTLNV